MNIINAENLTVSFNGRAVFKNLSFKVENGDFFCILGENGSGKTTLMRCILGLERKYGGKIEYSGFDKRKIGWLPQRTDTERDFPAGVYEVIASGFAGKKGIFGTGGRKNAGIIEENMRLLELSQLKGRAFSELSGGQQQRVLLCRALCAADRVLLLDEPVTGLDSLSQNELYGAVEKLNRAGMTVIMISHDVEYAVSHARHILHISNDESFFGAPAEYVSTKYYMHIGGDRI